MTLPTAKAHCYLVVILAFLENLLTFSDDEQQKIRIFSHTAHFFTEVNEMELDPFQKICFTIFSSSVFLECSSYYLFSHFFESLAKEKIWRAERRIRNAKFIILVGSVRWVERRRNKQAEFQLNNNFIHPPALKYRRTFTEKCIIARRLGKVHLRLC